MLRQGAIHRENCFSSKRNETGLLRFFGNKTTQFFSGQSDWPADNSRKVRLAGMPATAGSLPPMHDEGGANLIFIRSLVIRKESFMSGPEDFEKNYTNVYSEIDLFQFHLHQILLAMENINYFNLIGCTVTSRCHLTVS